MNNRAESPVGFVFFNIIFLFLWVAFLGPYLIVIGDVIILNGTLTGFEAWFYGNLNLLVGIAWAIMVLAYGYFGGNN